MGWDRTPPIFLEPACPDVTRGGYAGSLEPTLSANAEISTSGRAGMHLFCWTRWGETTLRSHTLPPLTVLVAAASYSAARRSPRLDLQIRCPLFRDPGKDRRE